jgi:von Willebrand factor type A domain
VCHCVLDERCGRTPRPAVASPRRGTMIALAIFVLSAGASANGATHIRISRVEMRGYPKMRLTVVTPENSSHPPTLEENGRPVADLDVENLGRKQSVVLAIDRSQSMLGRPLANAVSASRVLLTHKSTSDNVSFVTFASQAVRLTYFSASTIDADAALRSIAIDPRSGTTMYDAVVLAAAALKHSGTLGRAIMLITDGQEATSTATLKQAVAACRRARAAVYVVAIRDAAFRPGPLRILAAKTGGRIIVARPTDPLTGIYTTVDRQFRDIWQMTYDTAARPGHRLHLTVNLLGRRSATTTVTVPRSASLPKRHPHLPLTTILLIAYALVPVALAVIATTRKVQRRNVWTGF